MYFKIKIWTLGKETNALFRLWNKSHCFEEPGIQVAPGGHLGWCDQRALYSNILLLYLLSELYNCLLTPSQYCRRKAQSQGNGALPIIPMGFWYTLHFSKIPLYPSQTFLRPPPPQPLAFEMIAMAMVSSTKLTHRPLSTMCRGHNHAGSLYRWDPGQGRSTEEMVRFISFSRLCLTTQPLLKVLLL